MRKACIDLNYTLLDGSNQMKMLNLSTDSSIKEPSPEDWAKALEECQRKAVELKYEVTRVRGDSLTKE